MRHQQYVCEHCGDVIVGSVKAHTHNGKIMFFCVTPDCQKYWEHKKDREAFDHAVMLQQRYDDILSPLH
jgi:hypothetical protein